jgi:hypothetical protein
MSKSVTGQFHGIPLTGLGPLNDAFGKVSRVDKACPSAARGLPDFLTVSQADSNAEASSDVVSGSNDWWPNSEITAIAQSSGTFHVMALDHMPANASPMIG